MADVMVIDAVAEEVDERMAGAVLRFLYMSPGPLEVFLVLRSQTETATMKAPVGGVAPSPALFAGLAHLGVRAAVVDQVCLEKGCAPGIDEAGRVECVRCGGSEQL